MVLRRFLEVVRDEGFLSAVDKAYRYGPTLVVSEIGRKLFSKNSKRYWDFRLLLNWSSRGGRNQTSDFAESLFANVDFKDIDFESILDFGCALGDSAPVLRAYDQDIEIYLWDLSNVGLQKAIRNQREHKAKEWDGKTKVDLVYCSNVIEHVQDTQAFVNQLVLASNKWVIVQGPYNEKHPDGSPLSAENPLDEHIYTIDEEFIAKFLDLPIFGSSQTFIGEAPKAWPDGKQFYFVGQLRGPQLAI
jgi:hypothetical protein